METKPRNPLWLRVLDFVTSVVLAGCLAYLLTGEPSPFLSLILASYLFFGKTTYAPGELLCFDDVKVSLFASFAWPYLAWKKLDQDLQAPSSATYDAYVNDVHVGMLSDANYSAIKRQVLRDPRLYFAQVMNLGWVVIKSFDTFFLGIPMLAFWGMFALAYFEPESYGMILTTLQQGPDAIRDVANRYMMLLIELWFFSLLVQAVIRGRFPGFANVFDQSTTRLLRRQLKVASDGNVVLISHVDLPACRAA